MEIIITNLTKKLSGRTILSNISLTIPKGQVTGIAGVNGSGKSVLLKCIAGLMPYNQGEIKVENQVIGEEIEHPPHTGVLIEMPQFIGEFSGKENLQFLAAIQHLIGEKEIQAALETVDLVAAQNDKFKRYSLGMKQRLGIAQAIMENQTLLLLDEPTNALDEKGIKMMTSIIEQGKQEGKTIIVTSHDKDFLNAVSDIQYRLCEGVLEQ
ncbi:ATP-binding cassette domain-containing protein [Enterococcus eurekensis]|uniref:ATP-binding cassette domain-containing protein n=1 Tax=Enterococcus eurekensis TaxID=1159753 RepID=A0ABV9M5I9_9ENTE